MDFTNAYILGVQRRSDYFGENTASYRSVDTISVEGYIDVRGDNPDHKGVSQAIQQIDAYVASASSSAAIIEAITINGTGYGTGRIVSLDFPASNSIDENQITVGKYTADIEVYNSGYLRDTFESASVPHPEFLESFSEDFSFSLGEDNSYELNHSLNITYLSGIEPDGTAIDPIETAKSLAVTLFDQTPTQFSTAITTPHNSAGESIASASRKYTNETYNLIDGSCDFQRKFTLLPSGASDCTVKIENSFAFDEGGIIKVSEEGQISPSSPEFLPQAKAQLDEEINQNSFPRCAVIYDSYKNYLGTNAGSLINNAVTSSKSIDNSAATANYTVEYTDDKSFANLNYIQSRTTVLDRSDNIITVTENGTRTSVNFKGVNFNPYSIIPSRTEVKNRCEDFYTLNDRGSVTLKNLNNKFTIPKYGKEISYTYAFTDDPDVFDRDTDATFARKKISLDDKIGVPNQNAVTIPNIPNQVLHTPGQTSLGSRSAKLEGQLRRTQFSNNLDSRPTPTAAITTAKTELLTEAYMVYADNNQIFPAANTYQLYVNNANYSFGSDNSFNMSIDATFSMQRATAFQNTLVFNP